MTIDKAFEGVRPHPCVEEGCDHVVPYDDEPWCFTHSPDSGSSVRGFSYRAAYPIACPQCDRGHPHLRLNVTIHCPCGRDIDRMEQLELRRAAG